MSEFGITPGPWKVRELLDLGREHAVGYAIDFNADQKQVVDYVYEKADAHLISASPELFDCLKEVFVIGNRLVADVYGDDFVRKARAALAKAVGQ